MNPLKKYVKNHERLTSLIYRMLHPSRVKITGGGNIYSAVSCWISNSKITISGNDNVVLIKKGWTKMDNCRITIRGNNNKIQIMSGVHMKNVSLYIDDSNGEIFIGEKCNLTGMCHIAVTEGTNVFVGEHCLFSQNVSIRTGDSHSIIDNLSGKRINSAKDVVIGNHVWIGHSVTILKGTIIGNDSVVATGAILTAKEYPSNSVIGGVGGRILKQNVTWCSERI